MPSGGYGYSSVSDRVAHAALDALESMGPRINVVRAILKATVSKALCEEFEEIAITMRRAAGMRNDVVHCVWSMNPNKPEDLLALTDKPGRYMRYTPKDFDNIVQRFKEEIWKLEQYKAKCAEHRHRQLQAARARAFAPPKK
jgi:hypothetical protein